MGPLTHAFRDRSSCCKAFVKVEGDPKEGTYRYTCLKCGQPCDLVVVHTGRKQPSRDRKKK